MSTTYAIISNFPTVPETTGVTHFHVEAEEQNELTKSFTEESNQKSKLRSIESL